MSANRNKEKAINRAKKVIKSTEADYDNVLANTLAELDDAVRANNFETATRVAQNIAGEASQFGWTAAADVAVTLRNILESPDLKMRDQASELAISSLRLIVAKKWKDEQSDGGVLMQSLQRMAAKLGVSETPH
ncbi:MAG: hypothetical protein Tsb0010_01590 [Parvularculaceae bacterium]